MDTENSLNYFRDINTNITSSDFEILCLNLLQKTSGFGSLNNIDIQHNKIYVADDGTYQLDGYIEYTFLDVKMKVIVECKCHKNSIKREHVAILHNKIQSIGANKGILMSRSGFQYGAVQFARKHSIALLQVVDRSIMTVQNSISSITDISEYHRNMPKYEILMYDLELDFPMDRLKDGYEPLEKYLNGNK